MMFALTIPGLNNSGPRHWQTIWERQFEWLHRVQMPEWELADRRVWVKTLEEKICESPHRVFLVSHSLGSLTIAHLSDSVGEKVAGAFMVAPPDLSSFILPPIVLETFSPVPTKKLSFPSMVIASSTDPYCSIEAAQKMAQMWGSRFLNIGECGHIGSDLEGWPGGLQMFLEFVKSTETI